MAGKKIGTTKVNKKTVPAISPEIARERELKQVRELIKSEPTWFYSLGDKVRLGHLDNCVVSEIIDGGKIYEITYDKLWHEGQQKFPDTFGHKCFVPWYELMPRDDLSQSAFYRQDRFSNQNYVSTDLSSLQSKHYYWGINYEAPYQRPLVWTLEQKQNLILSMFAGRNIGTFAFRKDKDICAKPLLEIVDGKQRLSTIIDFLEGRFPVGGLTYRELSWEDRVRFDSTRVMYVETELTDKEALEYFLFLNFAGTPQSEEHLQKVKKMLEETK